MEPSYDAILTLTKGEDRFIIGRPLSGTVRRDTLTTGNHPHRDGTSIRTSTLVAYSDGGALTNSGTRYLIQPAA